MTPRLCLSGAITSAPLRHRDLPRFSTFLTLGIPPLFQPGAVWRPKNLGSARHTRPGSVFDFLSGDARWSDRLSGWKSKACPYGKIRIDGRMAIGVKRVHGPIS
jgi:hypothetical protein